MTIKSINKKQRSYKDYGARYFSDCFRRHSSGLYWAIMTPSKSFWKKNKIVPIENDEINDELEALYKKLTSRNVFVSEIF